MLEIGIKESVLKIKSKIAKLFGVKAKHFELTYGTRNKSFLEPHFDWSYVWEMIEEVQYNSGQVNITYDKYDDSDIEGRSITYSISKNEEYLVGLCNYLKSADAVSSLEATNVIGRLPVLEEKLLDLKVYIESHKIKKYDHWYAVLKVKFDQPEEIMFKMCLLQEMLAEPNESLSGAREEFINHYGINFLIDIIVQSCNILINEGQVDKFPLCASLVSKTLKIFKALVIDRDLDSVFNSENSLILIKSGLQFLEYVSDIGNNSKPLADLMQPQIQNDKLMYQPDPQ